MRFIIIPFALLITLVVMPAQRSSGALYLPAIVAPPPTATATPTATPTPTNTPTPTATFAPVATSTPTATATEPAQSGTCSCAGDLYNCSSFSTHAQAQACFNWCKSQGRGDIHRLDSDGDGDACESLPRAFKAVR